MKALLSVIALALPAAATSDAVARDRYEVSLTRKDRNLYKVDGQPYWVQTRYCYVYAYGEEAALNDYEVVFFDSEEKCDVKRILREASVSPGTYRVSLTHEDDDFYSTLDDMFIKTSMCLSLTVGGEAILRLNGYGGGTVFFLDEDESCDVEAVFSRVRL